MSLRGRRGPGSLRRVLAGLVAGLAVVLERSDRRRDHRHPQHRQRLPRRRRAARDRQQVANALLTDLLSAQSANRAYILLPSGDNLSEYQVARDRYPASMAELRERVRGEPELEASADAVDRTAQLWFSEAVGLIRLRRQGRERRPSAASTRASARRGSTPSAPSTAACSRGSSGSAWTRWRATTAAAS